MKQKTRFKNFRNIRIGYRSMNCRYIGIGPKKAMSVDPNFNKLGKHVRVFGQ